VCSDSYTTKHLVRGTLRPDETADNLPYEKVGKIKKEKNPSIIFRGTDNLPYEKVGNNEPVCIADEVPFDIPDTWEWVRFSSVVNYSMGKTPQRKATEYWNNPTHSWVSIADMVTDGHISKTKEGVNDYASDKIFKGKKSPAGTLLMSFKLTVGKVSLLDIDAFHNEAIISIYPFVDDDKTMTSYLFAVMPLLSKLGETKTAIKGNTLNSDSLDNLWIPLPPFNEQKRICAKLNDLIPFIDKYGKYAQEVSTLRTSFPEQLKKSILQEAVQGKLVPQDPNDEPASVLLERIRAEKQALIKAGKIKKDKNESVIFRRDNSHYEKRGSEEVCIDDEIPFEIPDTWEWCRIGSLLQVNPRNNLSDDTDAGFVPMVLIKDGFNNEHSFEERKWGKIKSGFTHFANNDVIVAKITPCFQNRKSAVIANLPNGIGAGTTELHVLRDVTSQLCMQYILLLFKTNEFIKNGVKNFSGTAGQQRIGKDFISNYLIPLPPVKEQERIVNSVLKVFSRVNSLAD
jgi:type I restriction enzyme S subunit